jgi:hypothetical protein
VDQKYGLNKWARNILSATVEVEEEGTRTFPDGTSEIFYRKIFVPTHRTRFLKAIDSTQSVYLERLYEHLCPNGETYSEFVQDVAWYSGMSCYFIALKKNGVIVTESLWTVDEMNVG